MTCRYPSLYYLRTGGSILLSESFIQVMGLAHNSHPKTNILGVDFSDSILVILAYSYFTEEMSRFIKKICPLS